MNKNSVVCLPRLMILVHHETTVTKADVCAEQQCPLKVTYAELVTLRPEKNSVGYRQT